jgi:hypothetical protein
VSLGIDHDTAAFAVETIRRWWQTFGKSRYPEAKRLPDALLQLSRVGLDPAESRRVVDRDRVS